MSRVGECAWTTLQNVARVAHIARGPRAAFTLLMTMTLVLLPMACRGDAAPALLLADGTSRSLSELRGRWVLLNYWAEWCAPCREEIPELNALQVRAAGELVIYGVNYDGVEGAALHALAAKMGIGFASLRADPAPLLGIAKPEVLPTTVLIDPGGGLQILVGPQSVASLEAAIDAARLGERSRGLNGTR